MVMIKLFKIMRLKSLEKNKVAKELGQKKIIKLSKSIKSNKKIKF